MTRLAAATVACFLAVTSPAAADVLGQARVVDGDTLEIHGTHVRMHGIDAPERYQTCTIGGASYKCGQAATLALSEKIGKAVVSCVGSARDRYDRLLAICFVGCGNDLEDLSAWMVASGQALAYRAYSNDYVALEDTAKAEKRGLWAGEFLAPWDFRKR